MERTRLSVLRHAPCSRSRGGQPRHVRPARAPRDRALLLRLPGAERATGVLPQLANRGVRRGVQLQRPPHHRAVRDGDDDALPNAATGCEAQAMEEHAAEDIKHFRPTTVRLPAARSLPLGLADGGHAALRGRAGHGSRFHSSLLNLPRYYLSDAKNSPTTFQFSHRSEACRRESPKGPCLASHNSGQAQWSFS